MKIDNSDLIKRLELLKSTVGYLDHPHEALDDSAIKTITSALIQLLKQQSDTN